MNYGRMLGTQSEGRSFVKQNHYDEQGKKLYPFSNRNWHSIETYGIAVGNRLWDACENGNVDAMEHYARLQDEYREVMDNVHEYVNSNCVWVRWEYVCKLREYESAVSTLRAEGLVRMGKEEYLQYC